MDVLQRMQQPSRVARGNGCWVYVDRLEVWLQEAAEVRAGLFAARDRSVDSRDIRVIDALIAQLDRSVSNIKRRMMRPV